MVFSSLTFICVFLPLVFFAHQLVPNMAVKNALLIVASLAFYAYGEPVFVLLMIGSTLVNWFFGLAMEKVDGQSRRKLFIILAVFINLAFLAVFKYAGMAVSSLNSLTGLNLAIAQIALPIGISFYTFQAMSYVIDVYRGEVEAQRSYFKVLLYISFFPQLIAGPIVKYRDIEKQLTQRKATLEDVALGFRRFCVGLGKKVLIANTMALAVDSLFGADLTSINITAAWLAALAYLMQIYFDFSGYSDMAIGMARMFGFRYKENFNHPYASFSIKEFWRKWHISLSTWFKEYLYIPLGGNRKGKPRAVFNKMVVFLLCGLWHGASWVFVLWGLIHGLLLLMEEYVPIHKLPKPLGWLYTILMVTIAFVLFRSDSFDQAAVIISQMFTGFHFEYSCVELTMRQLNPVFIVTFVVSVVAAMPVSDKVKEMSMLWSSNQAAIVRTLSYVGAVVLLVLCLLSLSGGGYNPFIYYRF